ncbi:hypothetical protein BD310DRAFT_928305 [Dichomitus squalens]|uniref:Uncharacterized protein n=1 Tax=Dichomitus squalens TaxID=114155 RepID=A0A4Q9PUB7_9APHY|nr:hypothetical protein BD310DRAFT_928305 [Dichomitus squalens]
MRLLDVDTGSFLYFTERDKTPPYAILSHTWDSAGEQTYQEVKDIQSSYLSDNTGPLRHLSFPSISNDISKSVHEETTSGDLLNSTLPSDVSLSARPTIWDEASGLSAKIRRACEAARNEGVRYMWIDSACIDKTSSSELSESINSMYIWYRDAVVCYAFLADVPVDEDPQSPRSRFRQSRWFRRGWTLQELIAPRNVVFFSMEWIVFGTKSSLATVVEEITGIERSVLTHRKTLDDVGVARRMSWAARRETTRVEDRAYSLFGIFGINLPTLYGEGEQAFRRLQEEILRRIPDQSLFAWGDISLAPLPIHLEARDAPHLRPGTFQFECNDYSRQSRTLFAPSPDFFQGAGKINPITRDAFLRLLGIKNPSILPVQEYSPSPYGIRTHLPLLPISTTVPSSSISPKQPLNADKFWCFAILACEHSERAGHLLCRVCFIPPTRSDLEFLRTGYLRVSVPGPYHTDRPDLFTIAPSEIEHCRADLAIRTIYLPHEERTTPSGQLELTASRKVIKVIFPGWAAVDLRAQGYEVVTSPVNASSTHQQIVLNHAGGHTIKLEYQCKVSYGGWGFEFVARAEMSSCVLDTGEPGDFEELTDGPRTVTFRDSGETCVRLLQDELKLSARNSDELTLRLFLELAAESCYYLRIEVACDASGLVPPKHGAEGSIAGLNASPGPHRDETGGMLEFAEGDLDWLNDEDTTPPLPEVTMEYHDDVLQDFLL